MVRLHTENQLQAMPGSSLKVCVVGGGGLRAKLVIAFGLDLA